MADELWFEQLASATAEPAPDAAPARLKSRVYSAMLAAMADRSPLLDLRETKKAGGRLCVFEDLLTVWPSPDAARSMNPCRVCHARVLGERMTHAPIFWPGCPFSEFHNG